MKDGRRTLKVEGAVEAARVAGYLEQLAQALRAGTVRVRQGEHELVVGPQGVLGFSLAVTDRGKRQRLKLALNWRKYDAPSADAEIAIDAATR